MVGQVVHPGIEHCGRLAVVDIGVAEEALAAVRPHAVLLDEVEVKDLRAFEDGLYPYLESVAPTVLTDIATKKALDDDLRGRMTQAIKDYKADFLAARKDKKETAAAK